MTPTYNYVIPFSKGFREGPSPPLDLGLTIGGEASLKILNPQITQGLLTGNPPFRLHLIPDFPSGYGDLTQGLQPLVNPAVRVPLIIHHHGPDNHEEHCRKSPEHCYEFPDFRTHPKHSFALPPLPIVGTIWGIG